MSTATVLVPEGSFRRHRHGCRHEQGEAGRSGHAGFVQVIEGRTPDRRRFMELEREIETGFVTERPDFLGSVLAWWPDGNWVEVACFRSEAEARAAERRGLSPALQEVFADWQALAAPSSYLDLGDPWLVG